MWLTHREFGPEVASLLRERKYADAVSFWKSARPLAQLTVPGADLLSQIMETDPPCLAFLKPREREEIQIAAGLACLVGASGKLGRFVSRKMDWPHQLSKDAAVHNLLSAFHNEQLINRIIAEQQGYKTRIKVRNSCEGACITCLLASSVDFPLEHCPSVPIVGCVNYEKGCRCSLEVTSSVPQHDVFSRHFWE